MRRACARAWTRVASTAAIHAAGKRVASVIHERRLSTASSFPSNSSATAHPSKVPVCGNRALHSGPTARSNPVAIAWI